MDPQPGELTIPDIARGLAYTNRFHGQTVYPYSVAAHSVNVAMWLLADFPNREDALEAAKFGLLHDASEAYLGDVAKPVKRELGTYQVIEANLQAHIYETFAGRQPNDEEVFAVNEADIHCFTHEVRSILPVGDADWGLKMPETVKHEACLMIDKWTPERAMGIFLNTVWELNIGGVEPLGPPNEILWKFDLPELEGRLGRHPVR